MTTRKFTRRDVLLGSVATSAGLLAATGGIPALAQDKPPEQDLPVGTKGKLTVIHRTEYFEEAQVAFRDQVTEFAKAAGTELDISTTNPEAFGDFLGKMTAAVKAGNPPDFAYTSNVSIPQMHLLDLLEDVTDVVDEAVKRYGNIMGGINAAASGQFDGRWKAVPYLANFTGRFVRGDKLKEKGIDPASLKTWDQRREAALAISDPANDFYGWGMTTNKGGDGWGVSSDVLMAFGGHFTDETGQIVQFNSPETVAAFEWLVETYDRNGKYAAMLPPGVESWTDTGNNEAYLAGSIGYTQNAFSVYAASKKNNPELFANTVVLGAPDANNGDSRAGGAVGGWLTIFKGAPNVDLAKQLALDLLDPAKFAKISSVAGGLFMPAYENLWTDELLAIDPNFKIIKEQVGVDEPVHRRVVAGPTLRTDRCDPCPGHSRAGDRQRHLQAHERRGRREGCSRQDRAALRRRRDHAALIGPDLKATRVSRWWTFPPADVPSMPGGRRVEWGRPQWLKLLLMNADIGRSATRSNWGQRVLGRDWKVAYLFVLPMVLIMVGLIFWPFISAIFTSTTAFNFTTGETFFVGFRNYQRLLTNSDYLQALQNTIVVYLLVPAHQIHRRDDRGAAAQQSPAVPWNPQRADAAAVDRAGDRYSAGLAQHL